ncbi:polyadenylate-binding protein-interacting protein 2 isoform X2 [Latimeria chalumnae]|uniref:polyadenylate-binding protein-interacting protein 2 isoform X2 n=1 Tax=Latimeria chalumnae TaxID=7897 RepID=UPI0003C1670B|nr:PREDICTED: polyadenylate-binding protein-interacting protein 2 isoform X2 [Latimeria chalumnae]|eukprot:XP_006003751.1 PREDICTED: polyadenylate-binding protein-interacting protein 2 isoform X2 [Latimeria chalumnae]
MCTQECYVLQQKSLFIDFIFFKIKIELCAERRSGVYTFWQVVCFCLNTATMKDPSRSSTTPSIINEDVIINGHSNEDDNPFAEYMWMENEEEFNRQIEEELWEEEFIERCFQEMLEEEEEHEWFIPARDLPQTIDQIQDQFNGIVVSDSTTLDDIVKSNLNPNAKEFVPGVKYGTF